MADEDDFEKRRKKLYQYVFGSTDMGREVLADILRTCHYGASLQPENAAQIGEYNVGVMIVARCGGALLDKDCFNGVIESVLGLGRKVQ